MRLCESGQLCRQAAHGADAVAKIKCEFSPKELTERAAFPGVRALAPLLCPPPSVADAPASRKSRIRSWSVRRPGAGGAHRLRRRRRDRGAR